MQLSIEHIEREMAEAAPSPRQVADFKIYLAGHASQLEGQLQGILAVKPARWIEIREHKNSDRAADREWEATEGGIREMQLRMTLKRIDRLTHALSAKLRVMELEARNIA
jgi:hypothetical protein